jgi:bifunctional non-homologous end joining protein LigD
MCKESVNCSELPRMIKPMLAQARSEPFNCDKHLFEVKWDGTRCLSFIEDDRLRLQNRHLIDIGDRYPELACVRELPAGTVIDGEIVVLRHGRASFQKLQQRDHLRDPTRIEILSKRMPVRLMAFDLLYVRGRRITGQPLIERRQRLIDLVARLSHPLLIVPEYVVGHGIEFFAGIVRHGLEGMMAKRIESPYL